eukprot:TRINITY_DN6832_c0_g1_i3.p1 TRINITY_DN6832_c0_g1~~TRINITY_DN6832_c0_g1_i3.p1  ORF type:complete len:458 (-),score=67.20 TRINITY_DN6832_c0_g1_i3:143-1516(-)
MPFTSTHDDQVSPLSSPIRVSAPSAFPAPLGYAKPFSPQTEYFRTFTDTATPFTPRQHCTSPFESNFPGADDFPWREARSPEITTHCPQPHRPMLSLLEGMLENNNVPFPGCGSIDTCRLFDARPLSSLSTCAGGTSAGPSLGPSAGPTPSLEDALGNELLSRPQSQGLPTDMVFAPPPGLEDFWLRNDGVAHDVEAGTEATVEAIPPFTLKNVPTHVDINEGDTRGKGRRRRGRRGCGNGATERPQTSCVDPSIIGGSRNDLPGETEKASKVDGRRKPSKSGRVDDESFTQTEVVHMSTTQAGSKLLQQRLLKAHPIVIRDILDGIETDLRRIMCDRYGNYLCSAAFQSCSMGQRKRMVLIATFHFPMIAKDRWGTHALQALIGLVCSPEEQDILLEAIRSHAVELSRDTNGVRILQRVVQSFGVTFEDAIRDEMSRHSLPAAQKRNVVAPSSNSR